MVSPTCITKLIANQPKAQFIDPVSFSAIVMPSDNANFPRFAVVQNGTLWPQNSTLKIGFKSGTNEQKNRFKLGLDTWFQYINLSYTLVPIWQDADIRVSHVANGGNYSEIGANSKLRKNNVSLNIGNDSLAIILHEIGHALGLLHEQGNPASTINWNRDRVKAELMGPPNNWSEDTINKNVFELYNPLYVSNTAFDTMSIMLYPIPPQWTLDGFSVPFNSMLSTLDIRTMQTLYPKAVADNPNNPEVLINTGGASKVTSTSSGRLNASSILLGLAALGLLSSNAKKQKK